MHRNDACGDAVNLGQRIPHHQHQHQQQAISHFFKTRARRLTSPFSSVISGNLRCQNGNPQSRARAPLPHPRSTSQPPRHWETTPNATMIEVRTDQWACAPPPHGVGRAPVLRGGAEQGAGVPARNSRNTPKKRFSRTHGGSKEEEEGLKGSRVEAAALYGPFNFSKFWADLANLGVFFVLFSLEFC